MSENQLEICPVCQVKIENGDKVLFSSGPTGTRSKLWARVCQYVQKDGCINQEPDVVGNVIPQDYYSSDIS
ncbi:hypothetical protein [Okeania sp.]|uniref:hypothetical protein n=1 Tax=Okeania sp. TaxID=3100323 RepID=UPI002B4B31B0|nr:hypothetical protein [Okeania sp.]MEB3342459.1 hypothetical protein [Okeania sp.]